MSDDPNNRAPELVRLVGVFMALPILAIGIRFWSRIITRTRLWWDDWLALASLIFATGLAVMTIAWTFIGLGRHIKDVPPYQVTTGLKLLYAGYIFCDIAISLPKLSVLFFYARIFKVSQRFSWALWLVGALVVLRNLQAVLLAIFQCRPIDKAWHPQRPGSCINTYQWWLGSAISDVILDAIILLMPLPFLWELQLKLGRKLLVFAIFICGYSVIAVSIGRLVVSVRQARSLELDLTYNLVPMGYWLQAEPMLSIVGICLPSIFTFVKRGFTEGLHSLITRRSGPALKRLQTPPSENLTPRFHTQGPPIFPADIGTDSTFKAMDTEDGALASSSHLNSGVMYE